MLTSLSIRDVVLIDKLDLAFGEGLTVFTGETGAGKSIVLDSLSLALGARGQGGLVRAGENFGTVTASFDLPPDHPLHETLKARGLDDDDAVILRRVQYPDGRTKAFVNDKPASTAILRAIGSSLVEIHGQHDDRALLDPASHRVLLDQFGGHAAELEAVASSWRDYKDQQAEALRIAEQLTTAEREADYLQASCRELSSVAPEEGEEGLLAQKRLELQASAKIRSDLEAASEALSAPQFPSQKLNAIVRRLERQSGLPDNIKPMLEAMDRVLIEAAEASALVEQTLRDQGTGDLDAIEERLFKLRGLARKHRVSVDDLKPLHDRLKAQLEALEMGTEAVLKARRAAGDALTAYKRDAAKLSQKRDIAAGALDRAVNKELAPLKLEKAQFVTHTERLDEDDPNATGEFGRERIMFLVSTNPGAKPGPIMKVASGGELARFLLALKVVLASRNTAPVLVFDEIDTGVGGATASAIGERLARLGRKAQVLAVTHSPQVAASADRHFRLFKTAGGKSGQIAVKTNAEALDQPGRREEIARMLAGKQVTAEARAAAERLIGAKHEV